MNESGIVDLVVVILAIFLFFLPTIIAINKKHPHRIAIIATNLIGGLFWGVGWLIALVWCLIRPSKELHTSEAAEIEKLFELKEKGIITEEEYQKKKSEYF
ncbi:superinfection immunity protein [Photobacterium halotolerans]|uniref:SHOCT domain-containing protein n=1 Tax=Photobacterium halotolerans TaxID=265726 RepID=A0A0F5V977_9GAMM|nr:superinfection immunity protein [Photobacterium halotolerans]KKC98617.1 hypothetical protein KY46_17855 [Photobacterium halotolerans]